MTGFNDIFRGKFVQKYFQFKASKPNLNGDYVIFIEIPHLQMCKIPFLYKKS